MEIAILLLLTIILPLAWIIAEFRGSARVRRVLGTLALLWSFGVASLVGLLQNFNANVYFTNATKQLLTESLEQLKAGHTEAVIREWSVANDEFHPTYENRGKYQQIVDNATMGMKQPK